jgi:oxygen-dependent protoporphyrinogen oxidase
MTHLEPASHDECVDLAVVGGGMAGLAAAWAAHQRGWRVRLLEAGRTVGGKIRTERRDGYLTESGPHSFAGHAAGIWQLIDEIGLQDQVVAAEPPLDRFVYRHRRARRLPHGPGSLLSGDYMSLGGKLRMLAEPFVFGDAHADDTVMSFAQRRLGREAAQYLITPLVSGVFGGDPESLGARDAFPRLWQWEHQSGSVLMGALMGWTLRREPAPEGDADGSGTRRGLYSFRDGFDTLPKGLAAALPAGTVRTTSMVQGIEKQSDGTFLVRCAATADAREVGFVRARRVIVAAPARIGASLLREVPRAQELLAHVQNCRIALVHLGGPNPDGLAPRGSGLLIPPGEGLRTLGILMPSSLFPNRAPEGHWLHTGFVGGALDPDAVDLTDDTLISLVERAQQQAFPPGKEQRPLETTFATVVRWREAIPQYRVGHRDAMAEAIEVVEATLPGMTLAGSHLQGISVNEAALSGLTAVQRLARLDDGDAPDRKREP